MKLAQRLALLIGVLTVSLGVLGLFIPPPASAKGTALINQISLSITLMVDALYMGAALLFLTGLRSFKPKLKAAYILICSGFILLSIAYLQVHISSLIDVPQWTTLGLIVVPFLVWGLIIFLGVRMFASLLDIRSLWGSLPVGIGASIILSVLLSLPPHYPSPDGEIAFDATTIITTMAGTFIAMATGLIYVIRKQASILYTPVMTWLFAAMSTQVVGTVFYMIPHFLLPADHPFFTINSNLVLAVLTGALLLKAGLEFRLIEEDALPEHPRPNATPLDVVTYVVSLVSNPTAIDNILDTVRTITARTSGSALSTQQQESLAQVCHQIEDYLVHTEPVRKYDYEGLEYAIKRRFFTDQLKATAFWTALSHGRAAGSN